MFDRKTLDSVPGLDSLDVDVLMEIDRLRSRPAAAKKLGMSQGRVQHRLLKSLKALEAATVECPSLEPYRQLVEALVVAEPLPTVKLPSFGKG